MVDFAPDTASVDSHRAARVVDANTLHAGKVDDQAIVASTEPGPVMASATHGDGQIVIAPEVDGTHHVGHVDAPRNKRRAAVDHGVVYFASLLIGGIIRLNQVAAQPSAELADRLLIEHYLAFLRR